MHSPAVVAGESRDAAPTLAQVLTAALRERPTGLSPYHWQVIRLLIACRTPVLGGHRYHCDHCGADHFVPRSCGNRHCPVCQAVQAHDWLERQRQLLLPVPYFHVVFTLPHELNGLIAQNQRVAYQLLFTAATGTLLTFGRNEWQAQLGITAVLHTWNRTLLDHYHLHCLVTAGGLVEGGQRWHHGSPTFCFPVRALAKVFRGRFLDGLRQHFAQGRLEFHGQLQARARPASFAALLHQTGRKHWRVYAKRPFAGPEQVLGYFSRYTHRVALSPRRLNHLDPVGHRVGLTYRTNEDPPQTRHLELSVHEFLRRFAFHILPKRFVKIRHYGLLAHRDRQDRLARVRALLQDSPAPAPPPARPVGESAAPSPANPAPSPLRICPFCGQPALRWIGFEAAPTRASPT